MPLADLLATDRIVVLTEPGSRTEVLDAAARLLADATPLATATIGAALHEREALGSTGIGHGVAIPHARSNAFDHARGAFLRLEHPVDFAACDNAPVDLVFAMSVPEQASQQYLDTLCELAERFSSQQFRDALRDARDLAALRGTLMGHPQPTMAVVP